MIFLASPFGSLFVLKIKVSFLFLIGHFLYGNGVKKLRPIIVFSVDVHLVPLRYNANKEVMVLYMLLFRLDL